MSRSAVETYFASGEFRFGGAMRAKTTPGRCGFHTHPGFEIVYHDGVHGVVDLQGAGSIPFGAGSIVIHPPKIAHDQDSGCAGSDLCVLVFGPENVQPPESINRLIRLSPVASPWILSDINALLRAGRPESTGARLSANDHRSCALFLELIEIADSTEVAEKAAWQILAERADTHLMLEYASVRNIGEVADALEISADYLRHIYKSRFGTGLKRRLTQIRIQRACDLLTNSTMAIKVIAVLSGFDNDRHFCTSFHAEMGCSAGEYRRGHRNIGRRR